VLYPLCVLCLKQYASTEQSFCRSCVLTFDHRLLSNEHLKSSAALEDAILEHGRPEIINSDQGSQFTSSIWINKLQQETISLSMTGKGRCTDNANIERLWRSFKYEGSY
jgi:transposase InsO family protein